MGLLKPSTIIQFLILFSLLHIPALAAKQPYIVYLGSHAHGPKITEADLDRVADSHYELLSSFLGSKEKAKESIFLSYKRNINGFAAFLEEEEAAQIAKHPGVVSVFLNQGRKLHTTHSWNFMMLEDQKGFPIRNSIWRKAKFGKDTIIANLDTGVWPTSKSFDDKGYGPIPSRWKGTCQKSKDGFACNRKLIGARYFSEGYEAWGRKLNSTERTARDHSGHGSHTLSTAGGNFVHGASVLGVGNGTAKGGSPRARVAAYKVCWPPVDGGECFDADIMAAFDMAIHDGVDVISMSVGGKPAGYWEDGMSIGAFHAAKKGIVVVASAGNSGPNAGSVTNVSPWMITVAASTLDREFQAFVELKNGLRLKGTSLSPALRAKKFYPLINGAQAKEANASIDDAILCKTGTLDPTKVKGKILACLRGENARVEKGLNAARAGAVGMILCNDDLSGNGVLADAHFLPASHLTYEDGQSLLQYINTTKNPQATLLPPIATFGSKPAPSMASFSSTGPNTVTPEILKPDITAPGVSIIAAYSEAVSPTGLEFDKRRFPFNVESGTSMSCPHVAGVVGLLRTIHRDWSPAAIRSAIVTTARTRDNTGNSAKTALKQKASPFNYGNGHIRPNRAMDPGLVYDLGTNDYLNFLCSLGYNKTQIQALNDKPHKCPAKNVTVLDFNYPSVTAPNLSGSVTVTRTVKNVGQPGTYVVKVHEPVGVSVSVEPKILEFKHHGEEKSFRITLKDRGYGLKGYHFGVFVWTDGKHYVRSPIVVQTVTKE
ncbi:Subtilisin-like protease [Morus notabilis]|uniref:Subtilisin-like protease n=2 Tax=Morus notabilis TaxID=981085 RepID=W9RA47_9ROSA|nr:subtilisin-like protease SBT5.4 [Morus notabilis]EXB64619.1 Subtilisin-like protease [Morus notabilis]